MSRKRRQQIDWAKYADIIDLWFNLFDHNNDCELVKKIGVLRRREKESHSYNWHKNKTKHRCYKLTLNKARKSGLKIPDPTLCQIMCHKHYTRKHRDKKHDEAFKEQLKELEE